MQMSGGHLLAAGLDGGDTMISSNPSISITYDLTKGLSFNEW